MLTCIWCIYLILMNVTYYPTSTIVMKVDSIQSNIQITSLSYHSLKFAQIMRTNLDSLVDQKLPRFVMKWIEESLVNQWDAQPIRKDIKSILVVNGCFLFRALICNRVVNTSNFVHSFVRNEIHSTLCCM